MQISQNSFQQKNTKHHLDKVSKIFSKILPIYWAFLTFMLLKPGVENLEYPFMFEGIDKVLHLSIFTFLGFTFMAAFPKIKFFYFIQIMMLYGMLTEILQDEMHWGRSLEFLDLIADMVGVLIGYFIFKKFERTII
ncbi:VanZ family protein [Kaistella sp. SH40-3]|uniref:VanZ family protein n=1 Tax=unclassified Kaistella TaxID=2762626 RepID=UPI0027365021|nr:MULTISPECIES: VanZ family protein [unclassified Kaistella]MDP2458184.1 VanZ family protein [Kaistella sp. SH40-3]MDP2461063.1 VanZ family protein [Kaistella sp. SH19-2b]